jgi:hypothetical protein
MNSGISFDEASMNLFRHIAAGIEAKDGAREMGAQRPPRLWELADKHCCPVVGTCLPIEEVRKLARKHDVIAAGASDFEAHVTVVGHCTARNPLSEAVQKALDKRHALWVGRFARARTADAAARLWKEALGRGEAAGALWGVLTCRAATPELHQAAYEDIHMRSHQVGAGVRADLKRTAALEAELREVRGQAERAARRAESELSHRDMHIRILQQSLEVANAQAALATELKRQLAEHASGRRLAEAEARLAEAGARAAQLEREGARARALQERVAALEAEKRRLARALTDAEDERAALERFIVDAPECTACPDGPACKPPDFLGRRLLCVGGRISLQAHYRALVERAGGAIEFHDGGREEALSRLPDLLARADGVICPGDCVSHPAYYQLKRHCKRLNKPCVLLRNSGLASFAEGLKRLAEARVEIGAESPAPRSGEKQTVEAPRERPL